MQDFSLIRFLDRFVYRNPKKPKQSDRFLCKVFIEKVLKRFVLDSKNVLTFKKRKAYNPWGVKKLSVTSSDYAQKTIEEIPVDEQYLHK